MDREEIKELILKKHPSLIDISEEQVNGLIELFEMYNTGIAELRKENADLKFNLSSESLSVSILKDEIEKLKFVGVDVLQKRNQELESNNKELIDCLTKTLPHLPNNVYPLVERIQNLIKK